MKTPFVFKLSLLLAVLMLFCINSAAAIPYQTGNFNPVRENVDSWTCYDYAIDYSRNNPEWGIVTIARNPNFYRNSHIVNYQVEDDMLILYDVQLDSTCILEINDEILKYYGFYSPCYYKFWSIDETPVRNYKKLQDNSMEWLNV